MAALTAVAIVLVAVVVTVRKCKKRLQGIADFMSECILLLLTLTLQFNCSLDFSEKLKKAPKYKKVYLNIKQLQIFLFMHWYVTFFFTDVHMKNLHNQYPWLLFPCHPVLKTPPLILQLLGVQLVVTGQELA